MSDDRKQQARALLDAGNAAFVERQFREARDLYERALEAWDHPAIRFNLVRCLVQLDRTIEAQDHLALALKYGAAPLEREIYVEALAYKKLLASQIATVAVACDQAGVEVSIDGQHAMRCPGKHERRVAPGHHQIVGEKAGFLTDTLDVFVAGGQAEHVELELVPIEKTARITHRWPGWIPWVVLGGGIVVGGFAGLFQLQAGQDMDAFDNRVAAACRVNACADGDPAIDRALHDRAVLKNRVAIGLAATGAAAVTTGLVMLYLNRGRTIYELPSIEVTPRADGATVSYVASFD